jgi:hypothetical protein
MPGCLRVKDVVEVLGYDDKNQAGGQPDAGVQNDGGALPDVASVDAAGPDVGATDAGAPDAAGPDVGATDAGAPDAAAPDAAAPVDAGGTSASVEVWYGDKSATVALGSQPTREVNGQTLVLLQDVVNAAGVVPDPAAARYDFEASDGFKPSNRDPNLRSWTDLGSGYIDPVSRNVSWDAALGLAKTWSVKDVAKILASP